MKTVKRLLRKRKHTAAMHNRVYSTDCHVFEGMLLMRSRKMESSWKTELSKPSKPSEMKYACVRWALLLPRSRPVLFGVLYLSTTSLHLSNNLGADFQSLLTGSDTPPLTLPSPSTATAP